MIRLQKYLAACGIASRRQAEELIAAGRVQVNGIQATVGDSVEPETDQIVLDGRPVGLDDKVYVLLNKPRDVVTTVKDTHRRKTVMDCLRGVRTRVFPVGRLDMDVEGILIMTNDGELAHRLMHPSHEVEKVYTAWVKGHMRPETAERLAKGVELDDGPTAPAEVSVIRSDPSRTCIRLTLHEGRKREVKRMCAAVGHPVCALQRIAIGGIRANGIRPGEWRYLSEEEVAALRRSAGL